MNDRDTFAAAALTGLLARPDIDDDPLEFGLLIDHAYKWADAMLRERERTNHDAAPAARAAEPESSVPPGSVAAPANTHTLTEEEREAIEWCRDNIIPMSSSASAFAFIHTATLRTLLERLS